MKRQSMNGRTWTRLALGALLLSLFLIAALVVLVDPFQLYRRATAYMPPIDRRTQVYSNAGVARSYDYDSAVVGTSVAENFRPTQLDALFGGRFIKLCSDAGTLYNHAILLDLAYRTHGLKRVLYGLDVYSLVGRLDETGTPVPLYLYDDSLVNDVSYWLNRSVLGSFLPRCFAAWGERQDDSIRDSMYRWAEDPDEYGPVALYSASFTPPERRDAPDRYVERARANLEAHLLSFIDAHPETRFDIFFPPYSAAEWSNMESKGTLDAMLALRGLSYELLSGCDNVRLYDFSAREEWVLDLSNYKDTLHYGAWINDAVAEAVARGDGEIADRASLDAATEKLRGWAQAIIAAGGWCFDAAGAAGATGAAGAAGAIGATDAIETP